MFSLYTLLPSVSASAWKSCSDPSPVLSLCAGNLPKDLKKYADFWTILAAEIYITAIAAP